MTGEFCGRVATSGISTVIENAPPPWPAVPGIDREFSPPNWQPASSAAPAANALPRNKIRLIRRPPDQFATAAAGAWLGAGPGSGPNAEPGPGPGAGAGR